MIQNGGLLVHVNDSRPGIYIYDKEAITKHFVSQYGIYLDHAAALNKTALARHVRKAKQSKRK
jgi:hypothetical protein